MTEEDAIRRRYSRSQSFIHQVRILSLIYPEQLSICSIMVAILYSSSQNSLLSWKTGIVSYAIESRNPLFIKSEFSHMRKKMSSDSEDPEQSQSFIHQVRILSAFDVAYAFATSKAERCRNPLFIKSEFSHLFIVVPLLLLQNVAILYSSSQNSLKEGGIEALVKPRKKKGPTSQSFIHQVRILSAPPQSLALHGLKYSFPQASVFQL